MLNIGRPAEDRLYIPFLIASEHGLVDHPHDLVMAPGVYFANGTIPGASNGGAVRLGGETWGVDFVAGRYSEDELVLLGTEKNDVVVDDPESNVGIIDHEGLITLTNPKDMRVRIAGVVTRDNGWTREQYKNRNVSAYKMGGYVIGVISSLSRIQRDFRVVNITDDHEIIAKPI